MRCGSFLIVTLASAFSHAQPSGVYEADFSRVSPTSGGALQAIFRKTLHLRANHEFTFAGIGINGFWRSEGDRVILVFATLFNRPYAVPDEILKRISPKSEVDGLILHIKPNRTLILDRFGRSEGPVIFRVAKKVDTLTLLKASQNADPYEGESPYERIHDEMQSRERDILAIIANPNRPLALRRWATYFIGPEMSPGAIRDAAELLQSVDLKGLSARQARGLLSALSDNLAEVATPHVVETLLARRTMVRKTTIAKAMSKAKYVAGTPLLREWLKVPSEWERSEAAESLGNLRCAEALPDLQLLTNDPSLRARAAACAAILKISSDSRERLASVIALGELRGKVQFGDRDILEALGGSNSKAALPYLVDTLLSGENQDRRTAAQQIGRLGFSEGIPALLEAKNASPPFPKVPKNISDVKAFEVAMGSMFDYADVRKAVVEALYLFDRRVRSRH
jgi:HEAT repeat protein